MQNVSNFIKEHLKSKGADLVGFADLSELPEEQRCHLKYGISIGISIAPNIINSIKEGPNQEYYAEYKRLNELLNNISLDITNEIKNMGFNAIAKTTTEVRVEQDASASELPHKTVATRSGLGWIGKNALLITEDYGSAIRLTTVLTDIQLDVGEPINVSRCGTCHICQIHCSGRAIKGINWSVGLHRNEFYDAELCRQEARRLSGLKGINESLCGLCIFACPYTKRYLNNYKEA